MSCMERKIGEIFNYNGKWYQAIEQSGKFCKDCYFYSEDGCFVQTGIGWCRHYSRNDNKSIIYKKLEKVGEPFACRNMSLGCYGIIVQRYKVFTEPILTDDSIKWCDSTNETILIALNNKEDMEEKKIYLKQEDIGFLCKKFREITESYIIQGCDKDKAQSEFGKLFSTIEESDERQHLREFDIEAAKAGKPICTRNGRKARIVCFDRVGEYPILALIENDGKENVYYYRNSGRDDEDFEKDYDLMMVPEKQEGSLKNVWVARDKYGKLWTYSERPIKTSNRWIGGHVYPLYDKSFPEVKWEDEEPRELVLKPIDE